MDSSEQALYWFARRPGAYITAPILPVETADCVPQEVERLLRQPSDSRLGSNHLQPSLIISVCILVIAVLCITKPTADHEVTLVVDNMSIELFLVAVLLPRQQETTEVAVRQQGEPPPYTKGNFEFERVVKGWRGRHPVLDLRLKG